MSIADKLEKQIPGMYKMFRMAFCVQCHDYVQFESDDMGHARCRRCESRITPEENDGHS